MKRTAVEPPGNPAQVLPQCLGGIGVQVDEDESFLDLRRYRRQTVITFVEIVEILFLRDMDQRARVAVGPVMKTAVQGSSACTTLLLHEDVAAMRADIVKAAHDPV